MSTSNVTPNGDAGAFAAILNSGNGAAPTQPSAQPSPQQASAQPSSDAGAFAAILNSGQADTAQQQTGTTQQAQPGFLDRVLSTVGNAVSSLQNLHNEIATGAGKGLLQTAGTLAEGVQSGMNALTPGLGDAAIPPEGPVAKGLATMKQIATPENTAQKIGMGAESILEALAGDEALKGLSLGEKVLKAGKLAEYYEKASPFVKGVIERGLTSLRNATVFGGEEAAKGGSPSDVAKAATVGAAAGPVIEGATAGAKAVVGAASERLGQLWASASGKAIQGKLQDGIRSVISDVADEAGVTAESPTINRSVEKLADGVQSKGKALFRQLDSATDGKYTAIENKLKNVDLKLRDVTGIDDVDAASEERLLAQQAALRTQMEEEIDRATKAGLDPDIADQARAAWRQMSALRDIDTAVKRSTDTFNGAEVVSPQKLAPRLKALDDSGRLAEGLGDDSAQELLQQARDARDAVASHATKAEIGKSVAKGAAYGVGLGGTGVAVGKGVAHVLSGDNH